MILNLKLKNLIKEADIAKAKIEDLKKDIERLKREEMKISHKNQVNFSTI